MWKDRSAKRPPVGQILLGCLGLLLAAAGVWGNFGLGQGKIAGGLFILAGVVVVLLAAFYPHVDKLVELGFLKIPAVTVRRAEKQIERGQVLAGNDLESVANALDETLARYNFSQSDIPADTTKEPGAHDVLLADEAVFTIATLTLDDRKLVQTEVARLSRPGYQPDLDPRETSSRKTGHFYRMHRVPDSNIRLWYRLKSHSEPHTLYVVVVEKTAEGH